jgi:hypothetical protein
MAAKSICKDCIYKFSYGRANQKKKDCCNTIKLHHGKFPKYVKECQLFKMK